MKYTTVIKEKPDTCPFCHEQAENILQKGKYFLVLPARAPYTKNHILIIPKRHVNFLGTLTHTELLEMYKLIDIWTRKLHTKHKGISILLRDGLVKNPLMNKSVNHLHVHLLPDIPVYIGDDPDNRIWLEDKIYTKTAQRLKKIFL